MAEEEKEKKTFIVHPDNFIKELSLNRGFYFDIVKRLIDEVYPGLKHAAGLLGHCSGCLGFDTVISTDHGWGPRLQLFLTEDDYGKFKERLYHTFANKLPLEYNGFSTNQHKGCWGMEEIENPPINHWIQTETVRTFFNNDVNWNPIVPPTIHEWLCFTDQGLCELTSGEIYQDDFGDLTRSREWISYYPNEVWYFKMYCLWAAIGEERAFVGRCNHVGDFVGERLIAARIVNKLMRICFLLERKYYPYSKWFGTAFSKLICGPALLPMIIRVLGDETYEARMDNLCNLYYEVGEMHNNLGITDKISTKIVNFFDRPYESMDTDPFCVALRSKFEMQLQEYDLKVLSKTVLYDDSNFGSYKDEMQTIVNASRKRNEEGAQEIKTGG